MFRPENESSLFTGSGAVAILNGSEFVVPRRTGTRNSELFSGRTIMGARRIRREQRRFDMATSRRENGARKTGERERRDRRMLEIVRKGKLPFIPAVMSWLSTTLDKPAKQIVQSDVDKLLAAAK
jgi:hypothetical protein